MAKQVNESKAYRIREKESEMVKSKMIQIIIEHKESVKESEIIHVLIDKYIHSITLRDIELYREKELLKK